MAGLVDERVFDDTVSSRGVSHRVPTVNSVGYSMPSGVSLPRRIDDRDVAVRIGAEPLAVVAAASRVLPSKWRAAWDACSG